MNAGSQRPFIPAATPQGVPYWMGSLLIPGLGQLCHGRVALGFVRLVALPAMYVLAWPMGAIAHACNVLDAYLWHQMHLVDVNETRPAGNE